MDDYLYADNILDNMIPPEEAIMEKSDEITIRDCIRSEFAGYGVEIEFSGKEHNERGVVIDLDEEVFRQVNPDVNVLRFGQTVVRVKVV